MAQPGKSLCSGCARTKGQRYGRAWQQHSTEARRAHLAEHGAVCPGYDRDPHDVAPADLVVDHDLGVMCRSCNAVKANTEDRIRWAVPPGEQPPTP